MVWLHSSPPRARSIILSTSAMGLMLVLGGCSEELDMGPAPEQQADADRGRRDANGQQGGDGLDAGAPGTADAGGSPGGGTDGGSQDRPNDFPIVQETVVVAGAELLPERFESAPASDQIGPAIVYPADGTLIPRNVAPLLFQWEGPQAERYRLTLRSDRADLTVYTTDWKYGPEPYLWQAVANASSGGDLTVQAARLGPDDAIELGPEVSIDVSTAEVGGAIYYWSPAEGGIVRLPVGATRTETFLTGSVFACVGCHALSPDGTRLAYTRSTTGTPIGNLGVVGTDEARFQYIPDNATGYYPSFAPDNVRLAVARGGRIAVINSDTGADEGTVPIPSGYAGNHPAWSPLGNALVYAAGTSTGIGPTAGLGISEAGLVRVPYESNRWGAPEWLVPRGGAGGGAENLFYPAYSPDSRWVAFNRATEQVMAGGSPAGSELWIVSDDGGTPIRLHRAGGEGLTNSWPKWAPATADGRLWLAFTSSRPYGRMPTGAAQIWIAGITQEQAFAGADPSAEAFWMPFQDLANSNHVAYWAEFTKEDEIEE